MEFEGKGKSFGLLGLLKKSNVTGYKEAVLGKGLWLQLGWDTNVVNIFDF